ncbi:SDR family oxidoreductase [Xanthomonas bromi]|nr:SDR family oxidoreductase [Xanthomonas bromi]
MSLSKTPVIFGVGPGIGIAASREFAALGYRLALLARTKSTLERLVAQFEAAGTTAKGFAADGGDGESIDAVVPEICKWAEGDPSVVLFNAFTS